MPEAHDESHDKARDQNLMNRLAWAEGSETDSTPHQAIKFRKLPENEKSLRPAEVEDGVRHRHKPQTTAGCHIFVVAAEPPTTKARSTLAPGGQLRASRNALEAH